MKIKLTVIFTMLVSISHGFVGGYFVGVADGVKQYRLLMSSVKASILTYDLQALREGHVEHVINTMEIDLDNQIVMFSRFKREGRPRGVLVESEYVDDPKALDHDKYMARVADYRSKYPSYTTTLQYKNGEGDYDEEVLAYQKEVREAVNTVLEEYGKE